VTSAFTSSFVSGSFASFVKNYDEIPPTEVEALFESSGHSDARVVGRHVAFVAKYPESASAVVEFEGACILGVEGIYNATGDGDLFITKPSGIAVDGLNAHATRAGRQNQACE
jgi:hypothetical protein